MQHLQLIAFSFPISFILIFVQFRSIEQIKFNGIANHYTYESYWLFMIIVLFWHGAGNISFTTDTKMFHVVFAVCTVRWIDDSVLFVCVLLLFLDEHACAVPFVRRVIHYIKRSTPANPFFNTIIVEVAEYLNIYMYYRLNELKSFRFCST